MESLFHSFSLAMHFAFLLRPALSLPARTQEERVKNFLTWWLLFGRDEYPAVWACDPAHVRAVMEIVEGQIPPLLARMRSARPDVAAEFPIATEAQRINLLCWYRLFAAQEFGIAPPLPEPCRALTEQPAPHLLPLNGAAEISYIAAALHRSTPALSDLFDLNVPAARQAFTQWFNRSGRDRIPPPLIPARATPVLYPRRDLHGVNLVGFGRAEFGIGEDVRSVSRALEAVAVPHTIYSAEPVGISGLDSSRHHLFDRSMPYATTIFCVTAFDMADFYLRHGPDLFAGRHNIGLWPWEFAEFPADWRRVFDLVDEVWASSALQLVAYAGCRRCPVHLMPPAVCLPAGLRRRRRRRASFRIVYPLDPNSFLSRKNPMALVRAFRRAFPSEDRTVRLTLRLNGRPRPGPAMRALRQAISGDRRIAITQKTLRRRDALRDLALHDLVVSSHRAEGFGRNLAEAIALHVAVLGTGGSGNADFMEKHELLPYRTRTVAAGEYPHAAGLVWQEPTQPGLIRMLRLARQRIPRLRASWYCRRAARLRRIFSEKAAGSRYQARLKEIGLLPPAA